MTFMPDLAPADRQAHGVPRLVLASASPARRKLLAAAGIPADVIVSGVDESAVQADRADALCATLARMKAEAVAARLRHQTSHTPPDPEPVAGRALVLGCDSVLAFDGAVYGKPTDPDQAERRWRRIRGRAGVLYSGHCVIDTRTGRSAAGVGSTTVHFADLSDDDIATYVATGEPLRVAGGFTIDGLGAPFVERIEGDHGTVVGLSLPLLRRLLAELGVDITRLWRAD
jgi:septum formation protein